MSREIGFRAYIKPLKRYATGLDTIQFHKCCDVTGAGIWSVVTLNEGIFEADDIIIEQDTGLKDKNGKKIYEGDIIKVVNVHDGDEECWEQPYGPAIPQEVKWNEELLRWSFGGCRRILCVPEDFEIIGTIHENPELLEGEK